MYNVYGLTVSVQQYFPIYELKHIIIQVQRVEVSAVDNIKIKHIFKITFFYG